MEHFEPPKYIASLIAAINDGAKSAQLGALAFVAVGIFLLASTFAASDEDLLLNHSVAISQLGGVSVPVVFAFGLAPLILLAAHVYTLLRYDMLRGNVRRFVADLTVMVDLESDRERCRQLLANVEFIQAMVTPPGSSASSPLFRVVTWTILAWFPVTVLLIVQTGSLRLQHETINTIHHVCLALDLLLLGWFGFFPRLTWRGRFAVFGRMPLGRAARGFALGLMALVAAIDLAWLRVPGPDEPTLIFVRQSSPATENWGTLLGYAYRRRDPGPPATLAAVPLAFLEQPVDLVLCPALRWGCRFLSVPNRPLTTKVWDPASFIALRAGEEATDARLAGIERANLAGRNLRFADLHESELFGADLTGADLRRASLLRSNMQKAKFPDAHLEGADLRGAHLEGARPAVLILAFRVF